MELTTQQQLHVMQIRRENSIPEGELPALLKKAAQHVELHGTLDGFQHNHTENIAQMKARHRREEQEALRNSGYVTHRITGAELLTVLDAALESIANTGRANVRKELQRFVDAGTHEQEWVDKIAKQKPKKRLQAALEQRKGHPVLMNIKRNRTEAELMRAATAGTISTATNYLRKEYGIVQRHERELQAMRARLEAHDRRLDIIESGRHWHDVAIEMREQGAGYGAIGKAIGKSKSTVASFLKAQEH